MRRVLQAAAIAIGILGAGATAPAAEIRILTAGAMKEVVLDVVPAFEKETGHKAIVSNDTAGVLAKRIESGEVFDLAVLTPGAIRELSAKGKFPPGAGATVARIGVGVVVKAGAPAPDIATVEAFKQALLAAKSVAYIDPAAGGSSGIYVANLLEKLGIADRIRPKAKLKDGGHVADLIASGEAEIGLHQISEILAVKGVTLVGPLPAEIQNYTTYAAAVGAQAQHPDAAQALIRLLTEAQADAVLKQHGMERPPP